jgi:hypothetical protein
MADAEALGQFLGDEVCPGPQPALEHVGQERLDEGLPPLTAVAL